MIEILDETKRYPVSKTLVCTIGLFMDELGIGGRDLTVVLCEDQSMHQQNLAALGVDQPTDVLSFPLSDPEDTGIPYVNHLGDIMIGIELAQQRAAINQNTIDEEILILASHGLLHLLGHDHRSTSEWQDFDAAQTRILTLARGGLH